MDSGVEVKADLVPVKVVLVQVKVVQQTKSVARMANVAQVISLRMPVASNQSDQAPSKNNADVSRRR